MMSRMMASTARPGQRVVDLSLPVPRREVGCVSWPGLGSMSWWGVDSVSWADAGDAGSNDASWPGAARPPTTFGDCRPQAGGGRATPGHDTDVAPGPDTFLGPAYRTPAHDTEHPLSHNAGAAPGHDTEAAPGHDTKAAVGPATGSAPGHNAESALGHDTVSTPGHATSSNAVSRKARRATSFHCAARAPRRPSVVRRRCVSVAASLASAMAETAAATFSPNGVRA